MSIFHEHGTRHTTDQGNIIFMTCWDRLEAVNVIKYTLCNDWHFLSFLIMGKHQWNKGESTKRSHMNSVDPAQASLERGFFQLLERTWNKLISVFHNDKTISSFLSNLFPPVDFCIMTLLNFQKWLHQSHKEKELEGLLVFNFSPELRFIKDGHGDGYATMFFNSHLCTVGLSQNKGIKPCGTQRRTKRWRIPPSVCGPKQQCGL